MRVPIRDNYSSTHKQNSALVVDPYWNSVILYAPLTSKLINGGLPFYGDFSRHQNKARKVVGTSEESDLNFIINGTAGFPTISNFGNINIEDFAVINNKVNHDSRLSELNDEILNSSVFPTGIIYGLDGNLPFSLGEEFTIELSFYLDRDSLAWSNSLQTLLSVGRPLRRENLANYQSGWNYILPASSVNNPGSFAIFYQKDQTNTVGNLYLSVGTIRYQLNVSEILANTWYHLAVVLHENTLSSYINFTKVRSYSNTNINLTVNRDITKFENIYEAALGYCPMLGSGTANSGVANNLIDASFSGGLSNIRLTTAARYKQEVYSSTMPYPFASSTNKIDESYENVLWLYPFNFDLFNYSSQESQLKNKSLLFKTSLVDFASQSIYLDNSNILETETIAESLNTEWCIETRVIPYINKLPDNVITGNIHSDYGYDDLSQFISSKGVNTVLGFGYFYYDKPIIELVGEDNKKVLQIGFVYAIHSVINGGYTRSHFYLRISEDGNNWKTFTSENGTSLGLINTIDNTNLYNNIDIRFAWSGQTVPNYLTDSNYGIAYANQFPHTHIAIQKYNNYIYFYINGSLNRTFVYSGTIYEATELTLKVNSAVERLVGVVNSLPVEVGIGLSGLRITNNARYVSNEVNDFAYINSVQPLPLAANIKKPPKPRVLSLARQNQNYSTGQDIVTWILLLSQPVSNLNINDFTITQLEGVINASLVELIKNSEFEYFITVNTGEGNGKIILNFVDDQTVYFYNTTIPISNYPGELSFEGETYVINKDNPVPLLSSSSSPYINSPFIVELRFDSAIDSVDISKVGIINGVLSSLQEIDDVNKIFQFTVTPIQEDPVIVQALQGAGITTEGILSQASSELVRIFSSQFPILQLPLTTNTGRNDLSPSKLVLNEAIVNNTSFSVIEYPYGTSSSMSVNPANEESGLIYQNFNGIASIQSNYLDTDWTIEWFYRGNTSGSKFSHIFSIENPSYGFSVVASNGKIKIRRETNSTLELFPTLDMNEIDTPSFIQWSNASYTQQEKFPHFAITKLDNVYRFYRNGKRIALIQSDVALDPTRGTLRVGYYQNRITDTSYLLGNIRISIGYPLYTSLNSNLPIIPYPELPNITDISALLSYISIYSDNSVSNKATVGNTVTVRFISIVSLVNLPLVTIAGKEADIVSLDYNEYVAKVLIDEEDQEGEISFSIQINNEINIPNTEFTKSTNGSEVFIDNSDPTAIISTTDLNDSRYIINGIIDFNEEVTGFDLNKLDTVNCILSNIRKQFNSNTYLFDIIAINTGSISVNLPANAVIDSVGNYNEESNVFTRNVIVPATIPDNLFDYVVLLIQPINENIIDTSSKEPIITATNLSVVNSTSPIGATTSIYFNGNNSSLNVELEDSLPFSSEYTIEFFANFSRNAVVRLSRPKALPANNITNNSFRANWQAVTNASSYIVDVSLDADFTSFLPDYKDLNVGNALSLDVGNDSNLSTIIKVDKEYFVSKEGFAVSWTNSDSDSQEVNQYEIQLAYDINFLKPVSRYANVLTDQPSFTFGSVTDFEVKSFISDLDNEEDLPYVPNIEKGIVVMGLFGNETTYPKLDLYLEEATLRLTEKENYGKSVIVEDVEIAKWVHIAVVNKDRYTYLYYDGELIDKVKNVGFDTDVVFGYNLTHFEGYIQGIRITKAARYSGNQINIPILPYQTS